MINKTIQQQINESCQCIQQYISLVQQTYTNAEKYLYKNTFTPEKQYYIYEQEILKGENELDKVLESMKRFEFVIKQSLEVMEMIEKMKHQMISFIDIQFFHHSQLEMKRNDILSELNQLVKREIEKESIHSTKCISQLLSENNSFQQEMKSYQINHVIKDYGIDVEKVNKIEEWTEKSIHSVIYDSERDCFSYQQVIKEKSQLLFLIQTTENNFFGGYCDKELNELEYENDGFVSYSDLQLFDSNAFVFTFLNNSPQKYCINKSNRKCSVSYNSEFDNYTVWFGNSDIQIQNWNKHGSIFQHEEDVFNFNGKENALIGKSGYNCYVTKRLLIFQMIDNDESSDQIESSDFIDTFDDSQEDI